VAPSASASSVEAAASSIVNVVAIVVVVFAVVVVVLVVAAHLLLLFMFLSLFLFLCGCGGFENLWNIVWSFVCRGYQKLKKWSVLIGWEGVFWLVLFLLSRCELTSGFNY
jgi:hypothetical protein